jgi:hypothetical protein
VADNQDDIFEQFKEFLAAKSAADAENAADEDYEIEIFDEKGRGARLKRSHAKSFLNTLGIDLDPEPDPTDPPKDRKPAKPRESTGSKSVTRKYFTKQVPKTGS